MFNPLSEGPNREIITVQKFNPLVRKLTKEEKSETLEMNKAR
jgi:hypothetical protein